MSTLLPLVHSVAQFQKDFHPSHHSGTDWDYAAVSQEGKKKINQYTEQRENVTSIKMQYCPYHRGDWKCHHQTNHSIIALAEKTCSVMWECLIQSLYSTKNFSNISRL